MMKGGGSGGGGSSTTIVQPAQPSPEERKLIENQNKVLEANIARTFDEVGGKLVLKPKLLQIEDLQIENIFADQPLIELGREKALKFLKGDISITPEQEKEIGKAVEESFVKPAEVGLARTAEELREQALNRATALGRSTLDPDIERVLSRETLQARTQLETTAGALRAQQRFALGTGLPLEQAAFGQQLREFQDALSRQAVANRFALQRGFEGLVGFEQGLRSGASTSRTTRSGGGGGGGFGAGLAGGVAGGFAQAGGAALGSLIFSDERLKENVIGTGTYMGDFEVKEFNYTKESGLSQERQFGLIAQEVERVYPEAVLKDDRGYLMINYALLIPLMVEKENA